MNDKNVTVLTYVFLYGNICKVYPKGAHVLSNPETQDCLKEAQDTVRQLCFSGSVHVQSEPLASVLAS